MNLDHGLGCHQPPAQPLILLAQPRQLARLGRTGRSTTTPRAQRGENPFLTLPPPRHDPPTLLSGMPWVIRTRSSWRDRQPEFGKWEAAYKRYRFWNDTGLWQRPLALLFDTPALSKPT